MPCRSLVKIFTVPPISILDVKQAYWKQRRKEWQSLGIASEKGRVDNLLRLSPLMQRKHQNATSTFDPVLAEVMISWFSAPGDRIFDPFAGGSVRGMVASFLDRQYLGYDIRSEQIEENRAQALALSSRTCEPVWECRDSRFTPPSETSDLVLTCPPYYDLEVYSDDPCDLSRMTPEGFEEALEDVLRQAVEGLHPDRFIVIVVGDVRSPSGCYRLLPHKVGLIMTRLGCTLYNDMVLLQEPASAAMRAFRFMNASRKIAKCHQNVLVFVKGDPKKASARLPRFSEETV